MEIEIFSKLEVLIMKFSFFFRFNKLINSKRLKGLNK